jgi:mono/diheme cytochrome c family protein
MSNLFKNFLFLIISVVLLAACGDSEAPQEKVTVAPAVETAVQMPDKIAVEEVAVPVENNTEEAVVEAEVATSETVEDGKAQAEEVVSEVEATASSDKPYQVVDGVISANAIEGWKTYNGGGCGGCHGQGGIGAIAPNLGESVTKNLTKEQFVDIVTNGRSGTFMKPHKTNKRVMDNMDNLYAYFMARGDGVLGSENLIKFPLGKKE